MTFWDCYQNALDIIRRQIVRISTFVTLGKGLILFKVRLWKRCLLEQAKEQGMHQVLQSAQFSSCKSHQTVLTFGKARSQRIYMSNSWITFTILRMLVSDFPPDQILPRFLLLHRFCTGFLLGSLSQGSLFGLLAIAGQACSRYSSFVQACSPTPLTLWATTLLLDFITTTRKNNYLQMGVSPLKSERAAGTEAVFLPHICST